MMSKINASKHGYYKLMLPKMNVLSSSFSLLRYPATSHSEFCFFLETFLLINKVQFWGKQRGIGDASQGTLNSFGYTLLVLQFLQSGCDPVVLPRLIPNGPIEIVAGDGDAASAPNPFLSDWFRAWHSDNTATIGMGFWGLFLSARKVCVFLSWFESIC
jgi:hypothetical protein